MSKVYSIRYLRTAEKDLIDIFDYIKKDNISAALSLLERFDTLISRLAEHPLLGAVPKDERLRRVIHGTRKYGFLRGDEEL